MSETVLVTGASSGIGRALARLFAADGSRLLLVARNRQRLQALAEELEREHGTESRVITSDLSLPGAAGKLAGGLEGTRIDLLVNNAGLGYYGQLATLPPERVLEQLRVNVEALTELTARLLPQMVARGQGHVVNIGSLAGLQPGGPGMAVYYATKAYVQSFSLALAEELAGSGVKVTVVCPGPTDTEFQRRAGMEHKTGLFSLLPVMSEEAVARAAWRGIRRGRRVVVPGLVNKLLGLAGSLPPRGLALKVNAFLLRNSR